MAARLTVKQTAQMLGIKERTLRGYRWHPRSALLSPPQYKDHRGVYCLHQEVLKFAATVYANDRRIIHAGNILDGAHHATT